MTKFTDKKIEKLLENYDANIREAYLLTLDNTEKQEALQYFQMLDIISQTSNNLNPDKERLLTALGGKKSEYITVTEIIGSISQMPVLVSRYFRNMKIMIPVAIVALIVVGYVGLGSKPAPQVAQNDFSITLPDATGNVDDAVQAFALAASSENAIFDTQAEDTTILANDEGAYSFDQNLQ